MFRARSSAPGIEPASVCLTSPFLPLPGCAPMVRAAVLYAPNERMPVKELEQVGPKSGEVRVRIGAAGICASDHHIMLGQTNFPMPIVLGHEGAGVVEEVGPDVRNLSPGDRCVLSFVPSCGHCRSCRTGLQNICDTNRETGTRQYDGTYRLWDDAGQEVHQFAKLGVFAESIVCPQQACYPMPDDVPMPVAALIGCSVTTGVGGVINQPSAQAGMTVAVVGVGGVGLNALQAARLLNASKVIAVDILDTKLEFAYRFGATDVVNSRAEDAVARILELTDGGVDMAIDAYGSGATMRLAYDATRKGGTCVLIGLAPEGEDVALPMVNMVRDQKQVVGSYYGSGSPHETFGRLMEFYRAGKLDIDGIVTRQYGLDDINEAYDDLAIGLDGRGVIVFDGVS